VASDPDVFTALGAQRYVLLTTTRRSGVSVPTAVWVARYNDALLVTTVADAGKVKRIRHTPRVTVQACDRAGKPLEGAPIVEAFASVHDDDDSLAQLEEVISAKYGVQFAAIRAMQKLRGRRASGSVSVRITAS
jgi:PPOX class probable F420-dependent enzyme